MKNRLKHYRVANTKTQVEAAKATGVTQPTYQRWEAGKVEIPNAALKKLAKLFKTTTAELMGEHAPIYAAFYDDTAPTDLQYYGEIAVHFKGNGEPLVLSISEEAHSEAYSQLQQNLQFITLRDLGNRTVAIRREAISEFYFSSEAYDTYGPEHDDYNLLTPIQLPDPRDWEIIEAIRDEGLGAGDCMSDYSKEAVERIKKAIMITDEQFEKLVAEGAIKPDDLEREKAARAADTEEIFKAATTVLIQFSTGKRREVDFCDCNLFECYEQFEDIHYPFGEEREGLIRLPFEGYHRTLFLNPEVVDFVSFPTHQVEAGRDESYAEGLDS